jgi:hypothetical protein
VGTVESSLSLISGTQSRVGNIAGGHFRKKGGRRESNEEEATMKSLRWFSLLIALLLTNVGNVSASRNPIGLDPQLNHQASPSLIRLQPCSVLWFGDDVENTSFLSRLGLSFTVTSNPADLSAANLANYDVLVIAYTGPGVIGAHQADIAAFVSANNGLLIHQPNNLGALDYAPAGFDVTITDQCWCGGCGFNDAEIVNGAHPITSGLVNADLSGDFDTATSLGAGYTLLARNVVCTNNPALAAGAFGAGRVAFETGFPALASIDAGSDAYWAHLFEWLCIGAATPTNADTWGRLKVLYR